MKRKKGRPAKRKTLARALADSPFLAERMAIAAMGGDKPPLIKLSTALIMFAIQQHFGQLRVSDRTLQKLNAALHQSFDQALLDTFFSGGQIFQQLHSALRRLRKSGPADRIIPLLLSISTRNQEWHVKELADFLRYSGNLEVFRRQAKALGVKFVPAGRRRVCPEIADKLLTKRLPPHASSE